MRQDLILLPVGALALLTFLVLTQIPIRRFRAGFAGKVTADDFKYGESQRVPGEVAVANRNYMNLLELPVLFYVLSAFAFVTSNVTFTLLVLAWVYVALRALHSFIHLTHNTVRQRLVAFAASNFVLMAMWVVFFVHYFVDRV